MKISYRTHPVLERLEKGNLHFDINIDSINKFKQNIQILTKPFSQALELSFWKLQTTDLYDSIQNVGGVLIDDYACYLYHIIDRKNGIIVKYSGNKFVFLSAFSEGNYQTYIDPTFKERVGKGFSDTKLIHFVTSDCLTKLIFIKYAEVQTKYLPAQQKIKGIDTKYVNDTLSNIKVLDSTWFTNLVKSDAFKVRGHFRLQPKKKEGEWTKELIWINEFQKEGYTREAGKLKEYPEV